MKKIFLLSAIGVLSLYKLTCCSRNHDNNYEILYDKTMLVLNDVLSEKNSKFIPVYCDCFYLIGENDVYENYCYYCELLYRSIDNDCIEIGTRYFSFSDSSDNVTVINSNVFNWINIRVTNSMLDGAHYFISF